MKKLYFVLSMMLSVTLFSCSGDDDCRENSNSRFENPSRNDESMAWKELKTNLEVLGGKYDYATHTRVGEPKIWPFDILVTDCVVGFVVRSLTHNSGLATICASIASERERMNHYLDIIGLDKHYAPSNPTYTFASNSLEGLFFQDASNRTAVDSVGYKHNLMILDINDGNDFSFNYIFSDSIYDDVCGYYSQDNLAQQVSILSLFNNDQTVRLVDASVRSAIQNDSTAEGILNTLLLLPGTNEDALQTLYHYSAKLYELEDSQISSYTSDVLEKVESSALKPEIIEDLKVGILIGHASRKLWNGYFTPIN